MRLHGILLLSSKTAHSPSLSCLWDGVAWSLLPLGALIHPEGLTSAEEGARVIVSRASPLPSLVLRSHSRPLVAEGTGGPHVAAGEAGPAH